MHCPDLAEREQLTKARKMHLPLYSFKKTFTPSTFGGRKRQIKVKKTFFIQTNNHISYKKSVYSSAKNSGV